MDENELKRRTKRFALEIIKLTNELPPGRTTNVLANQLLRAATSVGANYRSACRGRSKADFISKISIAEEEADECIYWLELMLESQILSPERANPLLDEARQLTAILTASGKTAKINRVSLAKASPNEDTIQNLKFTIQNQLWTFSLSPSP